MADVQITLTIPQDLARNAEEFGLLTPEHLIDVLQADVEQKVDAFVAEAVDEVREEKREIERDRVIARAREMLEKLDALEPKMTTEEIDLEIEMARAES
jgi:lipoate-protein ligase A